VPGDLAAPVHVDDRGARVAEGPVGHRGPFARGIDRLMLEEQAAIGNLAADPPSVHRALRVPGLDIVHGLGSETYMRIHEFSIHVIEITARGRSPRLLGKT
jgi:hypothetical protein